MIVNPAANTHQHCFINNIIIKIIVYMYAHLILSCINTHVRAMSVHANA